MNTITQRDASGKQRGLTLLEVVIALAVLTSAMASAIVFLNARSSSSAAAIVGAQMKTVADATEQYIRVNYAAYISATGGGAGKAITMADLTSGGYLAPSAATVNGWGQSYKIIVTQPVVGALMGTVLTQGGPTRTDEFNNKVVPQAAIAVGAEGGYTPTGDVTGESPGTIQGSLGGWSTVISSIPGLTAPGAGHLAARIYYSPYENPVDTRYLFREAQTDPDLNTMHTDILMANNGISGADNVNAGEVTLGNGASSGDGTCRNCVVKSEDAGGSTHDLIGTYYGWDQQTVYVAAQGNTNRVMVGSPASGTVDLAATGDIAAGVNATTGVSSFKLSHTLQYHEVVTLSAGGTFGPVAKPDCSGFTGTTAQILVNPQSYYVTDSSGDFVPTYNVWVQTNSDWTGTVFAYSTGATSGWTAVSGGRINVLTGCG